MVNKYVWELYLKAGGNEVVDFFQKNLLEKVTDQYAEKIANLQRVYCACADVVEDTKLSLQNVYDTESTSKLYDPDESIPEEDIEDHDIHDLDMGVEKIDLRLPHLYSL